MSLVFNSTANKGGNGGNRSNAPMVEGDYEVQMIKAEEKTSQSGTTYLSIEFVVREDVEQHYKKRHLWRSYFKDDSGNYSAEQLGRLINAFGVPEGQSADLEALVGGCCMVHVHPYENKKTGRTTDSIAYYKPTKAGQIIKSFNEFTETDDDSNSDLPF